MHEVPPSSENWLILDGKGAENLDSYTELSGPLREKRLYISKCTVTCVSCSVMPNSRPHGLQPQAPVSMASRQILDELPFPSPGG